MQEQLQKEIDDKAHQVELADNHEEEFKEMNGK